METWSEEKFDGLVNYIKGKRDQFIAHYDRDAAKFQIIIPEVVARTEQHGINLVGQEFEDFIALIEAMYSHIAKTFCPETDGSRIS